MDKMIKFCLSSPTIFHSNCLANPKQASIHEIDKEVGLTNFSLSCKTSVTSKPYPKEFLHVQLYHFVFGFICQIRPRYILAVIIIQHLGYILVKLDPEYISYDFWTSKVFEVSPNSI